MIVKGQFVHFIRMDTGRRFSTILGTNIFRVYHELTEAWVAHPAIPGCTPGRFLVDEGDLFEFDKDYYILEPLDISLLALPLKCECGAEKCKTTHAHWCPMWKEHS